MIRPRSTQLMGRDVIVYEAGPAAPGLRYVEVRDTDWEAIQVYSYLLKAFDKVVGR
jgi:hypothetical protein